MVTKTYTDEEFESLMSEYDYKFQKGDLVKGLVCGYDSEGVIAVSYTHLQLKVEPVMINLY